MVTAMTKVLLDTSIIIDHLRQTKDQSVETPLSQYLKSPPKYTTISTVTIQELFEGKSTSASKETKRLRQRLKDFTIIPLTATIAEFAGTLARDYGPMEFADAAIAATTINSKASLYTLNPKDFANIPNLKLYSLTSLN